MLYTVLKIDEVSNLGAARIRIRSLISAVNSRHEQHYKTCPSSSAINRIEFTKEMKKDYTVLAPQMSPIHFDLLAPAFRCMGINIEILPDATKETSKGLSTFLASSRTFSFHASLACS